MRGLALGLLAGISAVWAWPALPGEALALAIVSCLAAARIDRRGRMLALSFVFGVVAAGWQAERILARRLPRALEGKVLEVHGVVAEFPRTGRHVTRLLLRLREARYRGEVLAWGRGERVLLAWYGSGAHPQLGRSLHLRVKLRAPRGLVNPGGFDRERVLFAKRIAATGYVRRALETSVAVGAGLPIGERLRVRFERWRAAVAGRLRRALAGAAHAGLIEALAVGRRDRVSAREWHVLRATGTAHLLAISGLHVGLVAGVTLLFASACWRVLPGLARHLAARRAGAPVALLAAIGYAALAGFPLPTRRAMLMCAVVMFALWWRGRLAPSQVLALALAAVLFEDPAAPLGIGFWLSFGAVAVLLYGFGGRVDRRRAPWRFARAQALIAVGLLPVTVAVFGAQPLAAPFANLLAIPLATVLVVPSVLVGTILLGLWSAGGMAVLRFADAVLDLLWVPLEWMADHAVMLGAGVVPAGWALPAALVGAALLAAPSGVPARWLGVFWMLPLLWGAPQRVAPAVLRVDVLDVGQGLAVVLRVQGYALLYDAGPRWTGGSDAAATAIVPFLRALGVRRVDTLLLSHRNADHVGGAGTLLGALPVGEIRYNAALPGAHPQPCVAGIQWRRAGYRFRILHPTDRRDPGQNDHSCVLRVDGPGGSVLLPGDIERAAEGTLVARYGATLASDVLIAPHHGSRTSSRASFLAAVRPRIVVYSTGYLNRWRFPSLPVRNRVFRIGARQYDTASSGAISLSFDPARRAIRVRSSRANRRALWRAGGAGSEAVTLR